MEDYPANLMDFEEKAFPAVNCRATFKHPSGMKERRLSNISSG